MNKQLYLESESYFIKALNSAVECKLFLKGLKRVRIAEYFIKIENRLHSWNILGEISLTYIFLLFLHVYLSVKLLRCKQGWNFVPFIALQKPLILNLKS